MKKMKILVYLLFAVVIFSSCSSSNKVEDKFLEPFILDMVHHNPGEEPYQSNYNDPAFIKEMGYNGKVYFLFESPALAINWESVDTDILPLGSDDRKWVDEKATQIKKMQSACKEQDMQVYAMSDLVLFPKRLIEKYGIEETFGDPNIKVVDRLIRAQINEIFTQFPLLDGLVVRIGETYLHDAPYHKGAINDKNSAEKTIIPLIQILREEICVKLNKQLIFRTWRSFDEDLDTYMQVNDKIKPHSNLTISVKHCEGDFHRGHAFSKVIGQGRHKQIIEVQCAREYEGKGAYPNYVANSVIHGFEENANMPKDQINSLHSFAKERPDLYAGVWTWTRGGGWDGPYIQNEMWCDLNAWVMAQWAIDPSQLEFDLFNSYAKDRLMLSEDDTPLFRKLCLLSADAVVRGRNTTHFDMNSWWTRDQGIGWPELAKTPEGQVRSLAQKDESIAQWEEIVELANKIQWADEETKNHAIGSAEYGLRLYKIYRSLVYLSDAESKNDKAEIAKWIKVYDEAWEDYNKLPEQYSAISTLYTQEYDRHIKHNANEMVNKLRNLN